MGDYSCARSRASVLKGIHRWTVSLTHAAVRSTVWHVLARSNFSPPGGKKYIYWLTATLLADVKIACCLLLSTGVRRMSVTVSSAEGVTVLTLTSDPNSSCPPLCQLLKGLCYSPGFCTVSQQLKENQGISQSTLGVSSLIFRLGYGRLTDFWTSRTCKPFSYPCNLKSNIFNI